jgi:ketosteroid isomerase-like protein
MSKTWFEEYFKTWDDLDVDGVLAWVTDDATYEDTTIGHKAVGREQVRKFVEASFKNVPEARFEFVSGHDDGSSYAVEWIMQPMGIRGVSIGSLRDGKISANRDYWNGAKFDVPNA